MRIAAIIIFSGLALVPGFSSYAAKPEGNAASDAAPPVIYEVAKVVITPKPDANGETGDRELDYTAEVQRGTEIFPEGIIIEKELADNEAVVFIYEKNRIADLNLKGLFVSRDILFVKESGDIAEIVRKIPTRSPHPVSSVEKVRMVVQLAPGSAKKYNIRAGDKVEVINPE